MPNALGAEALVGWVIDAPSAPDSSGLARYNVGIPGFNPVTVTDPASPPSSAAGSSGSITGTVVHYFSFIVDGQESAPSAGSTPLVLSAKKASLTSVSVCSDARCTERRLYRSHDGGVTKYWIGGIYDNTTTTFTDDLAIDSAAIDYTRTPKSVSEIGANYGFAFARVNTIDAQPTYGVIQPTELTGKAGIARAFPGQITVPTTVNDAMRASVAVAFLTSLFGKPTRTQMAGAPVYKFVWSSDTARLNPRSLTELHYKGGQIPPEFLFGLFATQMQLKASGGAIVTDAVTLAGIHHGLAGIGTVSVGGTTYTGKLVARGKRVDPKAATDALYVKVTTAPAAGTFALKFKVGSGATYTGSAVTCYYDTSSKKMIRGGSQVSDWLEAQDEAGLNLGADTGENRAPFEILFAGDVTGLALNDEYVVPLVALIPGATVAANFTQQAPRFMITPRFGPAHAYAKRGGSVVEAQTFDLTLTAPKQAIYSLGPDGRIPVDFADNGYFQGKAQLTRRYSSREYEAILQADQRATLEFLLQGERIQSAPGVFSTYRESISFYFPQARVNSVKAPVTGPGLVTETVELDPEQPDDASLPFVTVTLYTRQDVALPA